MSVIGFDDIRFARYTDPPLTTIAQPKDELGREAMNMLIELLSGEDVPPPQTHSTHSIGGPRIDRPLPAIGAPVIAAGMVAAVDDNDYIAAS
jgi:hypothetical protein